MAGPGYVYENIRLLTEYLLRAGNLDGCRVNKLSKDLILRGTHISQEKMALRSP